MLIEFVVGIIIYCICIFIAGKITRLHPPPIKIAIASVAGIAIKSIDPGIIAMVVSWFVMIGVLTPKGSTDWVRSLWTIWGAWAVNVLLILPIIFPSG